MGQGFPTWQHKADAIKAAAEWATGVCGDWAYKKEAFSLPDDNDPWFELRMGRLREVGVDEIRHSDNIDPATGLPDVTNPRADTLCGQRQFFVELRVFGRDQEQDVVAWVVAERARSRLRFPFVRDRYFRDAGINLISLFEVVPMPSPHQIVNSRIQSEAVLEMDLSTSVVETDLAAVGTWIESVELTSTLRNPGGDPLDSTIQLDELIEANP